MDADFQEIQVNKTAHGLVVGDAIVLQASPSIFSGTHSVYEVLDLDIHGQKDERGRGANPELIRVTYKTVNTENIFAVADAIRKIE